MFVRAVAGVDHAGIEALGEKLRSAWGTVAQNENVGVQRLEIFRGVLERFAFGQTRSRRRDVDHVRAQTKRGQLERSARARARLDEKVDQRFALQRRDFFTSRVPTCLKASAVSRTEFISSAESSRRPSKSLRFQRPLLFILSPSA